jgi:hypothetical protein
MVVQQWKNRNDISIRVAMENVRGPGSLLFNKRNIGDATSLDRQHQLHIGKRLF